LTYHRTVGFGFISDPRLVPDLGQLVRGVQHALDELFVRAAGG
jgi:hypothetical protein